MDKKSESKFYSGLFLEKLLKFVDFASEKEIDIAYSYALQNVESTAENLKSDLDEIKSLYSDNFKNNFDKINGMSEAWKTHIKNFHLDDINKAKGSILDELKMFEYFDDLKSSGYEVPKNSQKKNRKKTGSRKKKVAQKVCFSTCV